MQLFLTALVSTVVSLGGMFLAYNYVPLDAVSVNVPQNLGSTITTILGTDTLSASRAVINTNFSNLNTDKLESGSSASTLTIGTLTLTNPLGVAYGGTASTTISLNSVILGNGASGFKTVTGHGTSGQFLTSNGAGSAPTWQTSAIDLAGNYAWTGNHNFAGTLTLVKNLIASTTITFSNGGAGLSYVFPTTRQASSTVLTEDGTGNLRFITPQVYVLRSQTNLNSGTSATATTSLATIRIPANTLGSVGTVFVKAFWELTNGDSCGLQMDIGSGSATTSAAQVGTGNTGYQFHTFDSTIMATSSNGVITSTIFAPLNVGGALNQTARIQGSPVNVPVTADSYISLAARSTGGGNTCTLSGYSVRVERF